MQCITPGSRLNAFGVFHRFSNPRVTAEINKCAKCDSDNESYSERDLGNEEEEGVTTEINKQT